jgi:hypothetical protein
MSHDAGKKRSDPALSGRLPPEFKPQFLLPGDPCLKELETCVAETGAPAEDTPAWIAAQLARHASADIMIVAAKVGVQLAGFMMLEPETMTASYSFVPARFRHKGLGQRFYSFACINLGAPSPIFVYPAAMSEEYAPMIKQLEIAPARDGDFCTLNPVSEAA